MSQGHAVSQASAIERLQQFANELDIDGGDLPVRPTVKSLVRLTCASPWRESLPAELVGADAPLVITLGQEALDAVRCVADHVAGVQLKLRNDDTYGREGSLGGRRSSSPLDSPRAFRPHSPVRQELTLRHSAHRMGPADAMIPSPTLRQIPAIVMSPRDCSVVNRSANALPDE